MKVVIVGGGTAGWSAAAHFSNRENYEVVIVEPADIPAIGVGESTIPSINKFNRSVGIEEFNSPKWLEEVNGTLKFSIEFADFFKKGHKWIHPFVYNLRYEDTNTTTRVCKGEYPLEQHTSQQDFVESNYIFPRLRAEGFIPYNEQFNRDVTRVCGYHIDAVKYGSFLKKKSLERSNITLVTDEVDEVVVRQRKVEELKLKSGRVISGDIYIDCTGFKGLLANAVGSEWDSSFSDRLFVNRALTAKLPIVDSKKQLRNTTYCHALKAGWVWNIPLQTEVGTGYVFSDRHTTSKEAEEEFKEHLHVEYGYDPCTLKFREIPFKVGHRPESWKENVVCIGLSASFLEPLESTAISTLHYQITTAAELLGATYIKEERKRKRFNFLNNMTLKAIASYVELHYLFSDRRDSTFWKEVSKLPLTKTQQTLLDAYQDPHTAFNLNMIKDIEGEQHTIFDHASYMFLFLGYDIPPNPVDFLDRMNIR